MKWVKFEDSQKPFNLILPHKMHFYEVYAQFTAIANGAREYTNKHKYDYFFYE